MTNTTNQLQLKVYHILVKIPYFALKMASKHADIFPVEVIHNLPNNYLSFLRLLVGGLK